MSVTSQGPPPATSDERRRVIDVLATAVSALDREISRINEAESAHDNLLRDLADRVLRAIADDEGYRLPAKVRDALGGDFYEGPLLTEAMRSGLLRWPDRERTEDLGYVETDSGQGILERIHKAGLL